MKQKVIILGLFITSLFISNPANAQMFDGSAR